MVSPKEIHQKKSHHQRKYEMDILDLPKITDQSLEKHCKLLHAFVKSSPDALTITDIKGHIVYASPGAYDIFGYDRSHSFIGQQQSAAIKNKKNHDLN